MYLKRAVAEKSLLVCEGQDSSTSQPRIKIQSKGHVKITTKVERRVEVYLVGSTQG